MADKRKNPKTILVKEVRFGAISKELEKEDSRISLSDNPILDNLRLITFSRPVMDGDLTVKGNVRQLSARSLSQDKKQLETILLLGPLGLRALYLLLQKEFEKEMIVRLPDIVFKGMPQLNGEVRTEYDHDWVWQNGTVDVIRSHWKSSKGNLVRVYPPSGRFSYWFVTVCDMDGHKFTGEDAEGRAFAVAEGYTRQKGH